MKWNWHIRQYSRLLRARALGSYLGSVAMACLAIVVLCLNWNWKDKLAVAAILAAISLWSYFCGHLATKYAIRREEEERAAGEWSEEDPQPEEPPTSPADPS